MFIRATHRKAPNVADLISDRLRSSRSDNCLPTTIANVLDICSLADTSTLKNIRGVNLLVKRIFESIDDSSIGSANLVKLAANIKFLNLISDIDKSSGSLNKCFTSNLEDLSVGDTLRIIQSLHTTMQLDRYSKWVFPKHLHLHKSSSEELIDAVAPVLGLDLELQSMIPPELLCKLASVIPELPNDQRLRIILETRSLPEWATGLWMNLSFDSLSPGDIVSLSSLVTSCTTDVQSNFKASALKANLSDNAMALLARLFQDERLVKRINTKSLDVAGCADAFVAAAACGLTGVCRDVEVALLVRMDQLELGRLLLLDDAFKMANLLKHEDEGRSILRQCIQSRR